MKIWAINHPFNTSLSSPVSHIPTHHSHPHTFRNVAVGAKASWQQGGGPRQNAWGEGESVNHPVCYGDRDAGGHGTPFPVRVIWQLSLLLLCPGHVVQAEGCWESEQGEGFSTRLDGGFSIIHAHMSTIVNEGGVGTSTSATQLPNSECSAVFSWCLVWLFFSRNWQNLATMHCVKKWHFDSKEGIICNLFWAEV